MERPTERPPKYKPRRVGACGFGGLAPLGRNCEGGAHQRARFTERSPWAERTTTGEVRWGAAERWQGCLGTCLALAIRRRQRATVWAQSDRARATRQRSERRAAAPQQQYQSRRKGRQRPRLERLPRRREEEQGATAPADDRRPMNERATRGGVANRGAASEKPL